MQRAAAKVRDLVLIPLFAILIGVCSFLAVPTPIPITMQTFGVFLALSFLGGKKGTAAICLYLLLGLAGLPVFSGFQSGVGALFGMTGGYLLGWVLSGVSVWLTEALLGTRLWARIVGLMTGLLICYAAGTAWFMVTYARQTGAMGLWTALLWCVIPFIIPDLCKLALALWLTKRLERTTGKGTTPQK